MSKNKKEKKQKKKQKQLEQVKASQQKFDLLELLKNEQLDTKPNFAKFLDQYVERISAVVSNGKIQFYPTISYSLPKILVRFLDGHDLVYDVNVLPGNPHYYMYDGLEEVQLNQKDIELLEMFFSQMFQFKFINLFESK